MTRIVITSEGKDLEDRVSMHFGRCPYFIVVETEGKEMKSHKPVENPYFENHVPFAVPEFISKLNPDVLITGGIGPRALQVFDSMNIKVIHGFSGKNQEAIENYLKGDIESDLNPCEHV
ncbi:MAG: NifB/NifX family molybdenum-iron cluster-binding protein [Candidatus Aenigmarchaeota archaeon]|nr:NifB/NifX family molybdenum-iron cluster-binding protein [Candidatus Aenigmarchaeota archaeon]MCK4531710.1 NifB/NifX family molybdenum-iron cluster-binding protein [Candidatus Aenigmarchaeota archaeon]